MNAVFLKHLDRFLGTLSLFFLRKQEVSSLPEHFRKIAVMRLWAIGESLLALPAIRALKTQWPRATIIVMTTPRVADVFRGQTFINEIHVLQPRFRSWSGIWSLFQYRKKFDLAIDFEPYFYISALLARMIGKYSVGFDTLTRGRLYTKAIPYRDNQHVVKTDFDLVRAGGVKESPPESLVPLNTPPSLRQRLQRARHPVPLIALAPGGGVDFRRWPPARFAEVADYLIEKHECEIVLVGDSDDVPILRSVQEKMKNWAQVVSNLSLPEMAALLSSCRLTIANDGGLMHVSAAMGTPTLGLFGPETPVRLGPYGPKNRALYHQLEDNPIINVSRGEVPGMLHTKGDLTRYVRAITVDEVVAAAEEMLGTEERTSVTASKTSVKEMACIS